MHPINFNVCVRTQAEIRKNCDLFFIFYFKTVTYYFPYLTSFRKETFSKCILYSRQTLKLKGCLIFLIFGVSCLGFQLLDLLLKCWEQVLMSSPMTDNIWISKTAIPETSREKFSAVFYREMDLLSTSSCNI